MWLVHLQLDGAVLHCPALLYGPQGAPGWQEEQVLKVKREATWFRFV